MEPVRLEPIPLALDESPADHPCADIWLYQADLALLNYLLQDLRALVRQASAGDVELAPFQTITWNVHGLARRTVVCDPASLLAEADVRMVGFLGHRRSTEEAKIVDATELAVIGEFRNYPGILSYSSIELIDHQWANLVVHADTTDPERWRRCPVHIRAAETLAPRVYHSVRIHNGRIHRGPIGTGTVVIDCTKYFDYDTTPMWHAIRHLPGGAIETIGSPWSEYGVADTDCEARP